jgi:hypothetical protein
VLPVAALVAAAMLEAVLEAVLVEGTVVVTVDALPQAVSPTATTIPMSAPANLNGHEPPPGLRRTTGVCL